MQPKQAKDWRGAALADTLAALTRALGTLLGTRPFLRGQRAWLEAQCLETPLVWWLRRLQTPRPELPLACVGAFGLLRR